MLTQDYLKSIFSYDPKTGIFVRIKNIASAKIGDIAGRLDSTGYVQISVKGKRYMAHRLAWLYMTGSWPSDEIDHINRIRHDNRFINLREVTSAQNNWNYPISRHNTSGATGVSYDKFHKKYKASIRAHNKQYHIGYYDNIDDAKLAYNQKKQQLHIL